MPNIGNGPCIYCHETSIDFKPENLLRCQLCRRIAHIKCLRPSSPVTYLVGDNFFTLTCRHCSHQDHDKIARVDLKM